MEVWCSVLSNRHTWWTFSMAVQHLNLFKCSQHRFELCVQQSNQPWGMWWCSILLSLHQLFSEVTLDITMGCDALRKSRSSGADEWKHKESKQMQTNLAHLDCWSRIPPDLHHHLNTPQMTLYHRMCASWPKHCSTHVTSKCANKRGEKKKRLMSWKFKIDNISLDSV